MRKITLCLFTVLVIFLGINRVAHSAGIEGSYAATGSNPGGKGLYKGDVTISKTQDTYKVLWSVGANYIGTGILMNDVLSVAYTDEAKKWFGTVVYKVEADGAKLDGKWTAFDGKTLGTETLVKK